MACTLLLIGLVVAGIIRVASFRVRRVTVALNFRFSGTKFSIALGFLARALSPTDLVRTEFLAAAASEIRFFAEVYDRTRRLLFIDLFFSDTVCISHTSQVNIE